MVTCPKGLRFYLRSIDRIAPPTQLSLLSTDQLSALSKNKSVSFANLQISSLSQYQLNVFYTQLYANFNADTSNIKLHELLTNVYNRIKH